MKFQILNHGESPPNRGHNKVYLKIDGWNDFGFVTTFLVSAFDKVGTLHKLGIVKIGFQEQEKGTSTHSTLPSSFDSLPETYFSLGNDVEYYKVLQEKFTADYVQQYIASLKDIVHDSQNLENASGQTVFKTSLLRDVSMSAIKGQFKRVLSGGAPLTDFDFSFVRDQTETSAGIDLNFKVKAGSKPTTNIHTIIGRNGVGKTTILNSMVEAIVMPQSSPGKFYMRSGWKPKIEIETDYFSGLVSVSFSAFDSFVPPADQTDPELGPCYSYVGLKDCSDKNGTLLKPLSELHKEFLSGLNACLRSQGKLERWIKAIKTLESDGNFLEMNLTELVTFSGKKLNQRAMSLMMRMSSGHAIVLLTVTKLVEKVEEKTLVILDEPESHLHPPLLSALTRALGELMFNRNGVAIIATHSPVVLQEVPSSCVWKITRSRLAISTQRPAMETFGENVGQLTREVFGLEVVNSGYHTVLAKEVEVGKSYDEVVAEFDGALGYEAKAILRAMIEAENEQSR